MEELLRAARASRKKAFGNLRQFGKALVKAAAEAQE